MGEVTSSDIYRLERKVENVSGLVADVSKQVSAVNSNVQRVDTELMDLKKRFQAMVEEQRKTAILQKAATELIRVRQELEQKFSNYKVVRETMIGVLQATDLALVKQTTISRVSEELMLSTPKYWLAPCLVAVAAWIGNDRDLAERAIAEACKRDEERTALTMALICRRNNKVDTCYEWLSLYFSKQTVSSFSEGSFVYIDAYINGVFGPDEKHMCDDYLAKWLADIKGSNDNFEADQKGIWSEYCKTFTCNLGSVYPNLQQSVAEFPVINEYLGRAEGAVAIEENFADIMRTEVDTQKIKDTIDKNLITLVSRYNDDEEPLRKEEAYLKAVRRLDGDEAAAKQEILDQEILRRKQTVNIVEQMTNAIRLDVEAQPSERKTAVSILSSYIQGGYEDYIAEKKGTFPQSITMNICGWQGRTADGQNVAYLQNEFNNFLNNKYVQEKAVAAKSRFTMWMILAIVAGVLGIIGFATGTAILGIIGIVCGIGFLVKMLGDKKEVASRVESLNQRYTNMRNYGQAEIYNCCMQWQDARAKAYNFENAPARKLVS